MWGRLTAGGFVAPYTINDFRRDFPRTSPPRDFGEMSPANLQEYGLAPVQLGNPPTPTEGEVVERGPAVFGGDEWTYTWITRPLTPAERAAQQALKAEERQARLLPALEIVAARVLDPETLTPEQLEAVAPIYEEWRPGRAYPADFPLTFNGVVLKVVQAHTSQADWKPDQLPALYTAFRPQGSVTPWVQPTGAQDAYAVGEEVSHPNAQDGGRVWLFRSKIAANTTIPGTDGSFHRWWEPVRAL
jgi:hypothetical protein